jgi:cell division protein FtsL
LPRSQECVITAIPKKYTWTKRINRMTKFERLMYVIGVMVTINVIGFGIAWLII